MEAPLPLLLRSAPRVTHPAFYGAPISEGLPVYTRPCTSHFSRNRCTHLWPPHGSHTPPPSYPLPNQRITHQSPFCVVASEFMNSCGSVTGNKCSHINPISSMLLEYASFFVCTPYKWPETQTSCTAWHILAHSRRPFGPFAHLLCDTSPSWSMPLLSSSPSRGHPREWKSEWSH